MAEREYPLGQGEQETQRQVRFGRQAVDRPLRRLLEDAGVEPGMRVLDLGSGAGSVALTVAELVGEAGSVVGVDKNPAFLQTARERARTAGYTNVTFVVGDLDQELDLDGEFDAVVGRFVLMYVANPTATLRSALRYLRSGGIVALHESNVATPSPREMTFPPSPLLARIRGWRAQAYGQAGTELNMGFKLYTTLLDAGILDPQMRAQANVFGGVVPDFARPDGVLGSLRSFLIEKGLATEDELDLDAIDEQLRAEFSAERKVALGPLFFQAWARKP